MFTEDEGSLHSTPLNPHHIHIIAVEYSTMNREKERESERKKRGQRVKERRKASLLPLIQFFYSLANLNARTA